MKTYTVSPNKFQDNLLHSRTARQVNALGVIFDQAQGHGVLHPCKKMNIALKGITLDKKISTVFQTTASTIPGHQHNKQHTTLVSF